jgi:hypothetical protein
MASQDAFVLVIDYDSSKAVTKFVGGNPVELVMFMGALVKPAVNGIKRLNADFYESAGEAHRAVWLKRNHDEHEIKIAILQLLFELIQELDRFNNDNDIDEYSAQLHAGFSEGDIELIATQPSGDGLTSAYACTERARKSKVPLVVAASVFEHLHARIRRIIPFLSFESMIALNKEKLSAILDDNP